MGYSGTHEGLIFGAEPSGQRISYAGAAFFAFDAEGRIPVEECETLDGCLRQIEFLDQELAEVEKQIGSWCW